MRKKRKQSDKYDSSFYLISRLFKEHVSSQSNRLTIAFCCMIIISITTAAQAWLMQPVLDDIFLEKKQDFLYLVPIIVLVNAFIKAIASFYEASTMKMIGQKIISDIQLRLYGHLIYADMKFLSDYPSGNLISRFTNDINAMKRSVSDIFTGIAKEVLTLIGLLFVMFYQSTTLACISIFIIPAAFYPIIMLGKRMRKISRSMQEELGDFTVRLDETFKNIKIIKSYCREEYEIGRASSIIARFLQIYRKASYVESASSPIMELLGGVAVALIIMYGGMEVLAGSTTPGAFFSFIAALLMAYRPLKVISQLNTSLQEGMAASKRLFVMIDAEPEIYDNVSSQKPRIMNYNIEFHNVYFSYKSDKDIIKGIDLKIPQGKTVALVGLSGSGKTTILNLLQRLYDADYGDIFIGDTNIQDIPIEILRKSTALVSQDVALFNDTIYENIHYGDLETDEEKVMDASLAAAAHDFIMNLPKGYQTTVGESGLKLSGGQRQRIAIARAILKDAPILLLDEATSALDAISEKQVQIALDFLKKGRTTIVIAHRLSTIENADLIYVISGGKVTESGKHKELLNKSGEYAKLYQKYKSDAPQ